MRRNKLTIAGASGLVISLAVALGSATPSHADIGDWNNTGPTPPVATVPSTWVDDGADPVVVDDPVTSNANDTTPPTYSADNGVPDDGPDDSGFVTFPPRNYFVGSEPVGDPCVTHDAPGQFTCITDADAAPAAATTARTASTSTLAAASQGLTPLWCYSTKVKANRTQACQFRHNTVTNILVTNGQVEVTGVAQLSIYSDSYTDPSRPTWGHQLVVHIDSATGTTVENVLSGTIAASGSCRKVNGIITPRTLVPQAFLQYDAFFQTTATAINATGRCTTAYKMSVKGPGTNVAKVTYSMNAVRCDNATGGSPRTVGCVIPFAAAAMWYPGATMPTIKAQILAAESHGIPSRLTRNKNDALIKANRWDACGDAPRIAGYQCDEYPIASSKQGLRTSPPPAGVVRRRSGTGDGIFPNYPYCQLPKLPYNVSGRLGVSVCMVPAAEQGVQAGKTAFWFRYGRVLDGDPIAVDFN